MKKRYFQNELNKLRQIGDEFARRNPSLAPFLGNKFAGDPDVERLLEGVAFLTGMVHEKLDDEFPEFIQGLAKLLYPQFLSPVPCMTLLQFTSLSDNTVKIAAGCEVASVPVDGDKIIFRSTMDVHADPLVLRSACWEEGDSHDQRHLVLTFSLTVPAEKWNTDYITLFLGDEFSDACALLRIFDRHLREIRFHTEGQPVTVLSADHFRTAGFDQDLTLLPWPDTAHPAYRCLQEYFSLPEKFLFIRLSGLQKWRYRHENQGFTLHLVIDNVPKWTPGITAKSFLSGVTPAINLFEQDAHPVHVDHRQTEYRILPAAPSRHHRPRIHSVKNVSFLNSKNNTVYLHPYAHHRQNSYHAQIRPATDDMKGYEHFISLPYLSDEFPEGGTLSISMLCTDGQLPESLCPGDLSLPTDNTPPRVNFRNICGISAFHPPKYQEHLLWRMLSQLNTNHFRVMNAEYLKDLLRLYLPSSGENSGDANIQRIDSVKKVLAASRRRFVRGQPVDGTVIRVECTGASFSGPGDFYLFGMVLDEFFSGCVAVNSFVMLELFDLSTQELLEWAPKTGCQRLL